MNWEEAAVRIRNSIHVDTDLNRRPANGRPSNIRFVTKTNTSIKSERFGYHDETGFIVSIGSRNSDNIRIPWSMLRESYIDLESPDGYDGKSFRKRFPRQAKDHPCHVHVVGQIFVKAKLADEDGNKYRVRKSTNYIHESI